PAAYAHHPERGARRPPGAPLGGDAAAAAVPRPDLDPGQARRARRARLAPAATAEVDAGRAVRADPKRAAAPERERLAAGPDPEPRRRVVDVAAECPQARRAGVAEMREAEQVLHRAQQAVVVERRRDDAARPDERGDEHRAGPAAARPRRGAGRIRR